VVHNPELAEVLGLVGRGEVQGMSHPLLAAGLADATGGRVTHDDLARYRVVTRDPLVKSDLWGAGATLTTNPGPSFGGTVVANALSTFDPTTPWTLPRQILEAADAAKAQHWQGPTASRGTTHVSVKAWDGSVASLTTSNGASSGLVIDGTGIQLNNMMGEADLRGAGSPTLPGQRLRSMMAPTFLDLSDGSVVVLGSGGSERIRTALAHVVTALVGGVGLVDAVAAPRMHVDHSGVLQAEPSVPTPLIEQVGADLAAHGRSGETRRWSRSDLYFGGVNAVHEQADGSVVAVADHRRGGAVAVLER
jgi:gamma-glutamyltranspeptidase/glutathione hydrolase